MIAVFVFGFVGLLFLIDQSRALSKYVPTLAVLGLIGFVVVLKANDGKVPDTYDDTMIIVKDGSVIIESLKTRASKRNHDTWLKAGAWSKDNQ